MPSATIFSKDLVSSSYLSSNLKKFSSTSYLPRAILPPPAHLCKQMNTDIRSNPILNSPYFDLAGHVESRAYCMDNIVYSDSMDETAILLDVGVKKLLPAPVPPSIQSAIYRTFEIRPSEGKNGLGMFAAQSLPAGGLIAVERPTIVAPYVIALQTSSESDLFAALLRRLTPDTVARVEALANCKLASECDALEGIIRTNAVAITLEVPDMPHPELSTHRAIFLNTSRCNHSCSPNAAWHWDAPSFSLALQAVRPIQAGQEITVSYIAPTYSRAKRRARLQTMYNFSCVCMVCARAPQEIPDSDAARAELHSFWASVPAFEVWCLDGEMGDHALIDAHKRAVTLIEEEGLQVLDDYWKHLDAVAMGYGALCDAKQFREWALRARDARLMGRKDAAMVLQKWIDEPEGFPVWGWRKSLKRRRQN